MCLIFAFYIVFSRCMWYNVAYGVSMSFNTYSDRENPLTLTLKNCDIAFSEERDCAFVAAILR